jgi:hypothetical protein
MHNEIWDTFVTIVIQFMRKALALYHNVHFGKSQALLNASKLRTPNGMVLAALR